MKVWCSRCYGIIHTMMLKKYGDYQLENEDLKKQIEQMKRCSNCKNFNRDFELCFFSGGDKDYHCRNRRWELEE